MRKEVENVMGYVRIKRTNIHSKRMNRMSSPTKIKFRKSTMNSFKRNTSNNKAIKKYRGKNPVRSHYRRKYLGFFDTFDPMTGEHSTVDIYE